MEYSEHVKQIMRQRFDLKADDLSRDHYIDNIPPEDMARILITWELGNGHWFDFFIATLRQVTGKEESTLRKDIFGG